MAVFATELRLNLSNVADKINLTSDLKGRNFVSIFLIYRYFRYINSQKSNQMKKLSLTKAITLLLLFCVNGVKGQTTETNLDQVELKKQFLGTWQAVFDKDTIVAEIQQFGNAFVHYDSRIKNGKKSVQSVWCYSFSPEEDKFKVFVLDSSGKYSTYIAAFTAGKKLYQNLVENFESEKVLWRWNIEFNTPIESTVTSVNLDGVETNKFKWQKIK